MANSVNYISLHQHSDYSFLDSCNQVDQLAQKAKDLGMKAMAITDHGHVHGAVKFYNACKKVGIKPIIGIESYFTHDHNAKERKSRHITILACNNIGLSNIYKLITFANTPIDQGGGFFYRPRISWDELSKYSKGLICLTGCMNSPMNHEFGRNKDYEKGKEICKDLLKIFGKEHLFVEMQMVNDPLNQPNRQIYIPEQDIIFEWSRRVASELGLRTVATNDSHFLNEEDSFCHEILKCIDAKATLNTPVVDHEKGITRGRLVFNGFDYHVKSTKDMLEKFTKEEIQTTEHIADMCNVSFENEMKMPLFEKGMTPDKAYIKILEELRVGWIFRKIGLLPNKKEYEERIKTELKDIKNANLSNYFLIVWDVLKFCRDNDIPVGPGRGSAAGSLVSYLLQITQVDPVKHGLYWERFWNRGRKDSMPDIDVDVSIRHKDRVVQYIKNKFGEDRVFPMMTIGRMESKQALKDVGKALGLTHAYLNDLTKHVPVVHGKNMSISEALNEVQILKDASQGIDDDIKKWKAEIQKLDKKNTNAIIDYSKRIADRQNALIKTFKIAQKLEGCARNRSVHACALLISDRPINDIVPLTWDTKKKQHITGFDMYDLEELGFLKLDILGLKTLDVIADSHPEGAKCLYDPEKYFGPWDDPVVYDLFAKGRTKGIFQLESPLGRTWCKKIKPKTQGELSDLVAIIRPAVLDTGLADEYLKNKKNPDDALILHKDLEPIFKETKNIMLFQEQMIQIAKTCAGFSLEEADKLRKACGKKLPEEMKKYEEKFIEGCKINSYNEKLAKEIWDWINASASYSFNKSHSMCYGGVLGYITAYIKVHYPENFILSLLKFSKTEQDSHQEIMELFYDAKLFNISIKPPSVKKGNIDFELENKDIYFGLSHIKHIGTSTIKNLENLGNLPWSCVLLDRNNKHLKRDVFIALILSGAFDYYKLSRKAMKQQFQFVEELTNKELTTFQKFLEGGILEKTTKKNGCMKYIAGTKNLPFEEAVTNFRNFLQSDNENMKIINCRRSENIINICNNFIRDYSPNHDFGPIEKAGYETYYLSVSLTCSEVDIYEGDYRKTHHLVEVEREFDGVGCCIIALVNKVNERTDKMGRSMAFIGLQDKTYQFDAPIFSKAWNQYGPKLEPGKVILAEGKKSRGGFQITRVEELV